MDGSCEIPSREGKEGFSLQGGEKIQNRLRLGGRARKSGGRGSRRASWGKDFWGRWLARRRASG